MTLEQRSAFYSLWCVFWWDFHWNEFVIETKVILYLKSRKSWRQHDGCTWAHHVLSLPWMHTALHYDSAPHTALCCWNYSPKSSKYGLIRNCKQFPKNSTTRNTGWGKIYLYLIRYIQTRRDTTNNGAARSHDGRRPFSKRLQSDLDWVESRLERLSKVRK